MHAHQEPVFRLAYLLLGDPGDLEQLSGNWFKSLKVVLVQESGINHRMGDKMF